MWNWNMYNANEMKWIELNLILSVKENGRRFDSTLYLTKKSIASKYGVSVMRVLICCSTEYLLTIEKSP